DTLTILGDTFWVDRITPAGGDSSIILLGRGTPPTDNRRRTGGMFDCSPA
ncbi:head-tail joining protein, partial [Salmonella sp. SAL4355]